MIYKTAVMLHIKNTQISVKVFCDSLKDDSECRKGYLTQFNVNNSEMLTADRHVNRFLLKKIDCFFLYSLPAN